jgi:uncharacterized protein
MKKSYSTYQLVELKFAPDGAAAMSFTGYGAVFGNIDAYGDVIEPGAFAPFLADAKQGRQPWPAMLSQHGGFGVTADDMMPIGVWDELAEDGTGLKVSGTLADTPRGREMYTLMKMAPRPAINGLSIGYIAKESEPRSKPEDPRRRLKRVDLIEISPVTFPANRLALVSAVKAIEDIESLREVEEYLTTLGLSKTQAVALVAQIKRVGPGDPVGANGGPGDPAAILSPMAVARAITILQQGIQS